MIYLDSHTVSRPCQTSLERMDPYLREEFAAASADDRFISDLVNASGERFVFTASGAEAIANVFWSVYLEEARKKGKSHIVISAIEDAPTMEWARKLEELGCTVKIAPVDEAGKIDVVKLAELINPRTALISVTMAHGQTGVIQPFEEIGRLAREKGVLLHLDAQYALGKFFFSFDSDYLTFSGDRIHSVKSSGGLFVKKTAPFAQLIQRDDVASFAALSAACQQATLYLDMMSLEVARLRTLLEEETGGEVLYRNFLRLPNVTALVFAGAHPEALLYLLRRKGIYASIYDEAISFTLSRMTTEEEILKAAAIIRGCVEQLRTVSAEA